MRSIRLLLALYILFLAVTPCSDEMVLVHEGKSISALSIKSDHNHSEADQDGCTPFCVCSCCATNIQLSHATDIALVPFFHNTKIITPYFDIPVLHGVKSIWQPPKLA
jgi:hypothetical protein